MSKLLTEEQVVALTGATQTSKQKQVLNKNGIFYVTKMGGGISLTWEMVNSVGTKKVASFDDEPNWKEVVG